MNKKILIIGNYGPGNELLSCTLNDLGKKNISTADDYQKAEPHLEEMSLLGDKYVVISDSSLRNGFNGDLKAKDLADLLESVSISGNTAILYSADEFGSLPEEIKRLVNENKLSYILKSNEHFESGSEFEEKVLKRLGLNSADL